MTYFFVNLKRFDVPVSKGGICPLDDSARWAEEVVKESLELGFNQYEDIQIVYFFPESLLLTAKQVLNDLAPAPGKSLQLGSQGVYRENVAAGGNFGAFTTFLPAAAAASIGCRWSLIGHSEERKNLFGLLAAYDPAVMRDEKAMTAANRTIHAIVNQEAHRAFESGLNVLLCVGETLEERGEGGFQEQKPRLERIFREQIEIGLNGLGSYLGGMKLVIGYEPRWAIGPGKTPPDAGYIGFAAEAIRNAARELYGLDVPVVYGGGLKVENAEAISAVSSISGGLAALTRFTVPPAFSPRGLKEIIDKYHYRSIL
jgi:triosephosphate isomerase (TIM)